ncbi:DoxX family protein [Actinokineospora auranticolor]|uniref:DoxX family protein n=1 Tax=Actinokineospora auranticolor TaxID=155976 RepID=UPI001C687151|nr:DoxX family protein [Actinokineospora auranticolor]
MSTEDDRPRQAGGYADSGFYTPSSESSSVSDFGSGTTAALPRPGDPISTDLDEPRREEVLDPTPHAWHLGADLGLLVLRVTVGALFIGHGLQKVFGLLEGPGIDGFAQVLTQLGFQQATLLAWVTGITELVGGALLVLGLFTPAAAAAVLGVMANAIWVRVNIDLFAGNVELESVYAAAAFLLLFAGAGKISLDRNSPWFRRAPAFGFIFLILAAGLSVVTLVVLR